MDTDTIASLNAEDFRSVHEITLDSLTHSTIKNISLYSNQAQITRDYKTMISPGQTRLVITRLTNVVDHDSVKVEGQGSATIKSVTTFKTELPDENDATSSHLEDLENRMHRLQQAKTRCEMARKTIQSYMENITVEHLDISKLGDAMDVYDTTDEKWDDRLIILNKEIRTLEREIEMENDRITGGDIYVKLRTNVIIDLYTVAEEEVEINLSLSYYVSHASWNAEYDVRVDMQTPDAPVQLIYKAAIMQNTSEKWENVPITLETARPTSGLNVPSLQTWNIGYRTSSDDISSKVYGRDPQRRRGLGAKRYRRILPDENDLDFLSMDVDDAYVTSRGHVNATFRVPGLSSIPSDEEQHRVTIAVLELEATISWVCVPRLDQQVHLEAKITNSSSFTFLAGKSSVYVDGTFISHSEVLNVSPKEVFICPLGVDPSIRITYYPLSRHVSETGFYTKSKNHHLSQLISVQNTKLVDIPRVRIKDNIPVSEDATLLVNLIRPALTVPPHSALSSSSSATADAVTTVRVAEGIIARWSGVEDKDGSDADSVESGVVPGRDGMLEWVCDIPAKKKIDLVLEWEVIGNSKAEISGL